MEKIKSRFHVPVYIRWIGWMLLVQFILINISASLYAYKLTHVYNDPALRNVRSSNNILVKTWRLFTGPRQPHSYIIQTPVFPYDTIQLKTKDAITIDCWYSIADSSVKGTVILFHGITANKGMVLSEAEDFRFQGYNVLLIDFRAHGNSSGNTTTIGMRESEEVKLAYEFAASKNPRNIFLWGTSMGAVAVTKAIAEYNLRPAGVILEMPFASMKAHLQARARALGFQGLPEKPFGLFVTWWIGIERGLKAFHHCTTDYAEKTSCPALVQWGTSDMYVLRTEIDKIYAAVASTSKKFVVYEGAGHESLLQYDPAKWRKETEHFLETNSK